MQARMLSSKHPCAHVHWRHTCMANMRARAQLRQWLAGARTGPVGVETSQCGVRAGPDSHWSFKP